ITDYSAAIRLRPEDARLRYDRGTLYADLGDAGRAAADFTEAARLNPEDPDAFNDLAWIRATWPDDAVRDGAQAVECAGRAWQLTGWQEGHYLDTMAAACAECGDFAGAMRWQTQALALAVDDRMAEYGARLEAYRSGRPWRDELPGSSAA